MIAVLFCILQQIIETITIHRSRRIDDKVAVRSDHEGSRITADIAIIVEDPGIIDQHWKCDVLFLDVFLDITDTTCFV